MADEQSRIRIEELNREYVHCIDDDRLEEWPAFFTDDCTYKIISRENHERGLPAGILSASSRGMLEDRVFALRKANIFEPHSYRHMVSATRLLGEREGGWAAQTNYYVARIMQNGETTLFSTGRYLDTVVFENGAARFKEKLVILDSRRIDTLLVIPI